MVGHESEIFRNFQVDKRRTTQIPSKEKRDDEMVSTFVGTKDIEDSPDP